MLLLFVGGGSQRERDKNRGVHMCGDYSNYSYTYILIIYLYMICISYVLYMYINYSPTSKGEYINVVV